MSFFEFKTFSSDKNIRLDNFLNTKLPDMSRTYIQKLIEEKMVSVNGFYKNKNYKIVPGVTIKINVPEPKKLDVVPQNIPIEIIYEDSDLLVVNKPKGMVVHPAPGNYENTLVNALLFHCKGSLSGINGILRPGIVHRIDKDTSGLLMVAKNDSSHNFLAAQIKDHSFERTYETIVIGNIKENKQTINTNISRHKTNRKKMAVTSFGGKNAITHYEVLKRYGLYTHLKVKLETGRTHQIRVHMAHIGHSVLGDEVYGNTKLNPFSFVKGQCLHARTIGFIHPSTQKYMEFTSNLPEYFSKILSILNEKYLNS